MPALKGPLDSIVLDVSNATLPPGLVKRRIWQAPELTSHSAAILTPARLYLIPGTSSPPAEVIKAVEQGADPAEVFGALVTMINLQSVRSVTHDLISNTVHVDAMAGSGMTGTWLSRATVTFAHAEPADAIFTKLWRRLGDDYKLRPDNPPVVQASQTPLAVLAGILFATAFLVWGSNAAADLGSSALWWLRPLAKIDWRLAAIAGGVASAIVQLWLYRRLTRPPARLELTKSSSGK